MTSQTLFDRKREGPSDRPRKIPALGLFGRWTMRKPANLSEDQQDQAQAAA